MHYYVNENRRLLTEGLNFRDILKDAVQVGLDSGAIVVTGGFGGDTLVDILFAIEEVKEVIVMLKEAFSELKELGRIIKGLLTYDLTDGLEEYFAKVQDGVKGIVKNGLVGDAAIDFLNKIRETVEKLINKVVRGVSKWVGTIIPDDFGLGGPAFEATITTALSDAAEDAYGLTCRGIKALPQKAQDLLLDVDALEDFLRECIKSVKDYVHELKDKMDNPDPEKAGLISNYVSNLKLGGELAVSPFTSVANLGADLAGIDPVFDSLGTDVMDNMETLPSWHPARKTMQWALPKIENFLEDIEENHCDLAAMALNVLMKVLLGAVGVLQIAMDEDFVNALRDIDQNKLDLFDFNIDLDLTDSDLAMEVAQKANIHKWNLNQLLIG